MAGDGDRPASDRIPVHLRPVHTGNAAGSGVLEAAATHRGHDAAVRRDLRQSRPILRPRKRRGHGIQAGAVPARNPIRHVRAGRPVGENRGRNPPLRHGEGLRRGGAVGPARLHASYNPGSRAAAASTAVLHLSTGSATSIRGTPVGGSAVEGVSSCGDSPEAAAVSCESNRLGVSAVPALVPYTGLPAFPTGPVVASGVVEQAFEMDPFRLFSISFFFSASTALTAVAWAASISARLDPSFTNASVNPTSWPANSRSSSPGAPVTVSGVVKASSPESLSFKRFGMTFTRMALSPTRARVSINGRFLRIGNSSANMFLLLNCAESAGGEAR